MISELVNYVGKLVVVDTSYGISVHVQRQGVGSLIQDSAFMSETLFGNNVL
jgi:hypothetical protein